MSRPAILKLVDIIPNIDSAETGQNSEPSLAVDPLDPTQMIAGAFGAGITTPYIKSTNGGVTWADFGNLSSEDKTIAWAQDGSAALTATLVPVGSAGNTEINIYSGTPGGSGFGSPINTFNPGHSLDQPWLRTGPASHVYLAYNDLSNAAGKTASVAVSTDGGLSFTPFIVDRVGGAAGQDAPSVRVAVNGNVVYSVFTRWNSVLDRDASGEFRFGAQVVIVRSNNGGLDGFTALGAGGNGVQVAATTSLFANTLNGPRTLGQERTGGDLAIAVDPNNANHVVVAYGDAPGAIGSGQLLLHVAESFDGGLNWTQKFTTSSSTRSAEPALDILPNGGIGLLYDNYDPSTNLLSQHLLTTANDFQTTNDITLATETNATPAAQFHPYLGDFFDLTNVGNTFYGIFSASNGDNGTNAKFYNVGFQRDFTGQPGTSSFQLTNSVGSPVANSIDPFVFSYQFGNPSFPVSGDLDGDHSTDLLWHNSTTGAVESWLLTNGAMSGGTGVGFASSVWQFVGSGDFNGDGTADAVWRNTSTGAVEDWIITGGHLTGGGGVGVASNVWQALGTGDFNGDGTSDVLWLNTTTGEVDDWLLSNGKMSGGAVLGSMSSPWKFAGLGDFNNDGTSDVLWQNTVTGEVDTWLVQNNHVTSTTVAGTQTSVWQGIGTGDLNGDGTADVLWRNTTTGEIDEWVMQAGKMTMTGVLGSVPSTWQLGSVGYSNGDGTCDLAWRDIGTGQVNLWQVGDGQVSGSHLVGAAATAWQIQSVLSG